MLFINEELAKKIDAVIKFSLHPTIEPWMAAFVAQARLEMNLARLSPLTVAKPQPTPAVPVTPTIGETAITLYKEAPGVAEISSETPREKICRLLILDPTSTPEDIRKAYLKACRENHTDKLGSLSVEERTRRSQLLLDIQAAYQSFQTTLSSPTPVIATPEDDGSAESIEDTLILKLSNKTCSDDDTLSSLGRLFIASPDYTFNQQKGQLILLNLIASTYQPKALKALIDFLKTQVTKGNLNLNDYYSFIQQAIVAACESKELKNISHVLDCLDQTALLAVLTSTASQYQPKALNALIDFLETQVKRGILDIDDYQSSIQQAIDAVLASETFNSRDQQTEITTYLQDKFEKEQRRLLEDLNKQLASSSPSEAAVKPMVEKLLKWPKGWSDGFNQVFQTIVGHGDYPQTALQFMAHLREAEKKFRITPEVRLLTLQDAFSVIANHDDEKYKKIKYALQAEILYLETVAQIKAMEDELDCSIKSYKGNEKANPVIIEAAEALKIEIGSANAALYTNTEPSRLSDLSDALKKYQSACEIAVRAFDSKAAHFRGHSFIETMASWIRRLFACVSKSCRREYEVDQQATAFRDTIKRAHTSRFSRHHQFFKDYHKEEHKRGSAPEARPNL